MATEVQKPNNGRDLNQQLPEETLETTSSDKPSSSSLIIGDNKEDGEPKEELNEPSLGSPTAGSAAPATDLEKKMRRAERFGVTVQLSEEEKRNSRAERFGTAPSTARGSDGSKSSEELKKRKARAERFGLPAENPAATPATQSVGDEEAKKKARQARFATAASKPDGAEEEKMKARALRFSQTPSGASPQVNGKASGEQETATVVDASGAA